MQTWRSPETLPCMAGSRLRTWWSNPDLVEGGNRKLGGGGPEGQKNSLAAARQLGHLVLSDRYDHFRTRHALVWFAAPSVTDGVS